MPSRLQVVRRPEPETPSFVISLDFELFWGLKDHVKLHDYRCNLLGVRRAIPAMLSLFRQYGVPATWATVGMLFAKNKEELIAAFPRLRPAYLKPGLSNYNLLDDVGANEDSDPFHFAPSLIQEIINTPAQEVATHTFSHYYCLEPGQTVESFRADVESAIRICSASGVEAKSIVFPRNQFNHDYLRVCADLGLTAYRGNRSHWLYQPGPAAAERRAMIKRGLRLLDSYYNVSGYEMCRNEENSLPVNVRASRFLRPYSESLSTIEKVRFRRIRSELEFSAEHGGLYHLWWHPHNFGVNTEMNLSFLERILERAAELRESHGMRFLSMGMYAEHSRSSSPIRAGAQA